MYEGEILPNPGYEVVLERAFDNLMKEIGA